MYLQLAWLPSLSGANAAVSSQWDMVPVTPGLPPWSWTRTRCNTPGWLALLWLLTTNFEKPWRPSSPAPSPWSSPSSPSSLLLWPTFHPTPSTPKDKTTPASLNKWSEKNLQTSQPPTHLIRAFPPVNAKGNQPWIFTGRTNAEANPLATWCKEQTLWKRPWCWERLRAGGEGDDREWDGWTASPTQWKSVWANSGRQWRTGKPGVLQYLELRRAGHTTLLTAPKVSHQVPTAPDFPPTHWRLLCRVLHKRLVLKPLRAGVAPSSDLGSLPCLYYLAISFSTVEIPPVANNSQTPHVWT